MAYQQFITPNLDPTVYDSGQLLYDWFAMCLATVETAFGTARISPTAWEAWEATENKHQDRNFPRNVYFPIWFSGYGGAGHVAICFIDDAGNMQIWTSPRSHKPFFDTYNDIDQLARDYGVVFVGWSEDLAGSRIIEDQGAPTPSVDKYQVIENYNPPKQVRLNKQPTNLWGMNYDFDYMKENPVEVHDAGEIVTVTNKVHHENGYDYYRREGQIDGFNVADCDDYTPPTQVPVPVTLPPPSAPVTIHYATTPVQLVTGIAGYPTAVMGARKTGSTITLPPGTYAQFQTAMNGMLQVAKTADAPMKYWINPADNVKVSLPVAPVTGINMSVWQTTYKNLNEDGSSELYRVLRDMTIIDQSGKDPVGIALTAGERIPIFGTVTKHSITYLIPWLDSDVARNHWYGIPVSNVQTGLPNMNSADYERKLAQAERDNRTYRKSKGHLTTDDRIYYAEQAIARAVGGGMRFLDGIISFTITHAKNIRKK